MIPGLCVKTSTWLINIISWEDQKEPFFNLLFIWEKQFYFVKGVLKTGVFEIEDSRSIMMSSQTTTFMGENDILKVLAN